MKAKPGSPVGQPKRNRGVEWDPTSGRTWRIAVGLEPDIGGVVKPIVEERPISASGVLNQAVRMIFEDPELRERLMQQMPDPAGPEQMQIGERKAS